MMPARPLPVRNLFLIWVILLLRAFVASMPRSRRTLWCLGSSSRNKASKAFADSLLLVMKPVLSVLQFPGRLDEVNRVVEASQVCQAGHGVDALMFSNLGFKHPAHSDGEAIFVRPCMIPGHVIIEAELPSLEFVLPVGVPKTIKTGGEGNGPLDALVFLVSSQ